MLINQIMLQIHERLTDAVALIRHLRLSSRSVWPGRDLVQLGSSGSARCARTIALSHLPSSEDRSCRSRKVISYL
jgi:hypothetical protein